MLTRVTEQFTDKPTRSQSSCRLVNSQSNPLAEMLAGKFGGHNRPECNFQWIILFVCCQYSTGKGLWL